MQRVAVVDYGMGNLHSVVRAVVAASKGSAEVSATADPKTIANADRVVFPGQGAIRDCMAELRSRDLEPVIRDALAAKPFLGICIGLQALMECSEEHASTRGLAVFPGSVKNLSNYLSKHPAKERLKVPHMGWNQVQQTAKHPLWAGIENGAWFYFMHGFYVAADDRAVIAGETDYGVTFASAAAQARVFAVQFHPEKSQRVGLRLLENFLNWQPR